jgi:hypothetical protein
MKPTIPHAISRLIKFVLILGLSINIQFIGSLHGAKSKSKSKPKSEETTEPDINPRSHGRLVIVSAEPDQSSKEMKIFGYNFGKNSFDGTVILHLSEQAAVELEPLSFQKHSHDIQQLDVALPDGLEDFVGSYLLEVTIGRALSKQDIFSVALTTGANGQGEPGPTGPQGPVGSQGDVGSSGIGMLAGKLPANIP